VRRLSQERLAGQIYDNSILGRLGGLCDGAVMPILDWSMPSTYRSIHKNDPARAVVAESEQAFLDIAQGIPPKQAVKILEYKDMRPLFIVRAA
jgi:hypothetical protein